MKIKIEVSFADPDFFFVITSLFAHLSWEQKIKNLFFFFENVKKNAKWMQKRETLPF